MGSPPAREVYISWDTKVILRQSGELLGHQVTADSLIFCYRDGTPILPSALTHGYQKISAVLGTWAGYRLHAARHAHASLIIAITLDI